MVRDDTCTHLFVGQLHGLEDIRVVLRGVELVASVEDRADIVEVLLVILINVLQFRI
jgi:hypothetical protein